MDATLYPGLSGLARIGPSTATQLARAIGLDRTGTTRHSSKPEAEGLLARLDHPDDARATVLTLAEVGPIPDGTPAGTATRCPPERSSGRATARAESA